MDISAAALGFRFADLGGMTGAAAIATTGRTVLELESDFAIPATLNSGGVDSDRFLGVSDAAVVVVVAEGGKGGKERVIP